MGGCRRDDGGRRQARVTGEDVSRRWRKRGATEEVAGGESGVGGLREKNLLLIVDFFFPSCRPE